MRGGWNKIEWTSEMVDFLRDNFYSLTNEELSFWLEIKLTSVRTKCYELGLKRMELEYWTKEQVQFLRDNYRKMGDVEIAEIFNARYKKAKGWSKKHIEKKRRYLGLKRNRAQVHHVNLRNVRLGRFKDCPVKAWAARGGASPDGTIRNWKNKDTKKTFPVIKVNGVYVHWNRYEWERNYGPIPKKMNVVFKDGDPYNLSVSNLELISDATLGKRNVGQSSMNLSDPYVAGIMSLKNKELRGEILKQPKMIELKRKQLQLNRLINGQKIS